MILLITVSPKMILLLTASPFYLLGLIFILIAVINVKRAKASLIWPSAQGRITSSQVVKTSARYGYSYKPEVEYEYSVAGRTYSGKRIAFGPAGSSNEARERALAASYQVGAPVEVFYNSARPSSAILERRMASSNVKLFIVGIALILFGFALPLLVGFGR
jgi:hypothetical protein